MPLPDIRTMILVANLVTLSMALIFALAVRVQRGGNTVIILWAAAFLSKSVGLLLIYLRPSLPTLVTYALANTFVFVSAQLFLAGTLLFRGGRLDWKREAGLAGAMFLALALLFPWAGYVRAVAVVTGAILGYDAAAILVLMRRARPEMRSAKQLVVFAFGLDMVLLASRIAWLLSGPSPASLFTPSLMTVIFYFHVILGTTLLGTALLVLLYREADLAQTVTIGDLQAALAKVRTLEGMLPICAWCKRIRDEKNAWHSIEQYVGARTDARFSHSICPECATKMEQVPGSGARG